MGQPDSLPDEASVEELVELLTRRDVSDALKMAIIDRLRAAHERTVGRRSASASVEQRRARFFAAIGKQPPAPPTDAQRAAWTAAEAEAERQAQEIYGERRGRDAA